MKCKFMFPTVFVLLAGVISASCSAVTKKDKKIVLENSKETETFSNQLENTSQEDTTLTEEVDWRKFYKASLIELNERKVQLEQIRGAISQTSKEKQRRLNRALDSLDQKYSDLKMRLVQMNTRLKVNMEHMTDSQELIKIAFERAFVRDMNELLAELKKLNKNKQ